MMHPSRQRCIYNNRKDKAASFFTAGRLVPSHIQFFGLGIVTLERLALFTIQEILSRIAFSLSISSGLREIPYRSYNIKNIQVTEHPIDETGKKIQMEYLWGIQYSDDERPQPVTILIQNNTPNILQKIQSDTALRKHGKLINNQDGTFLYKDIILGMDAFRRWLRGYGSSVIVLEPKSLACKMYDSAVKMLQCYQTETFI